MVGDALPGLDAAMRRAGRRDRQIVIQSQSSSVGSIGNPTPSWSTVYTVWAEYLPQGGKEILQSQRETTEERARFVTDFLSDVTTTNRIVFDSKNWDIESVREIGRGEAMEILVKVIR